MTDNNNSQNQNLNEDNEDIRKLNTQLFQLSLVVTIKNDKPAIEIRGSTVDKDMIKILVQSAYRNYPIMILPKFTNLPKSLGSLIEKGILYIEKNELNQDVYFFTF